MINEICPKKSESVNKGSGWSLYTVDRILIRFSKYQPLKGSSFLPFLDVIQLTKCYITILINFVLNYKMINKFHFDGIEFSTPIKQIDKLKNTIKILLTNGNGVSHYCYFSNFSR